MYICLQFFSVSFRYVTLHYFCVFVICCRCYLSCSLQAQQQQQQRNSIKQPEGGGREGHIEKESSPTIVLFMSFKREFKLVQIEQKHFPHPAHTSIVVYMQLPRKNTHDSMTF